MHAGQQIIQTMTVKAGFMSNKFATTEQGGSEEMRIESRFGAVTVRMENAVFFPHGLLGLPDNLHFAVTEFPKAMGQFKLFQCLNDHSLSFITLPVAVDNKLIERKDLEDACKVLNVELKNLLTLLIVSVKRTPEGSVITANVRAPVLIDTRDMAGIQYVFPQNKYDVRTVLTKA